MVFSESPAAVHRRAARDRLGIGPESWPGHHIEAARAPAGAHRRSRAAGLTAAAAERARRAAAITRRLIVAGVLTLSAATLRMTRPCGPIGLR